MTYSPESFHPGVEDPLAEPALPSNEQLDSWRLTAEEEEAYHFVASGDFLEYDLEDAPDSSVINDARREFKELVGFNMPAEIAREHVSTSARTALMLNDHAAMMRASGEQTYEATADPLQIEPTITAEVTAPATDPEVATAPEVTTVPGTTEPTTPSEPEQPAADSNDSSSSNSAPEARPGRNRGPRILPVARKSGSRRGKKEEAKRAATQSPDAQTVDDPASQLPIPTQRKRPISDEEAKRDPLTAPVSLGAAAPETTTAPAPEAPAATPAVTPAPPEIIPPAASEPAKRPRRTSGLTSAFRAAYGLQGITVADALKEASIEEVKKTAEVPAFVAEKAKEAYRAGVAYVGEREGWGEFMDLPEAEQRDILNAPVEKRLQAKARLLGTRAVGFALMGAEWSLRQPGRVINALGDYFQDAEKGNDRQTTAALVSLGAVAVGVMSLALSHYGIEKPRIDASGLSTDGMPDIPSTSDATSAPEVPATPTAPRTTPELPTDTTQPNAPAAPEVTSPSPEAQPETTVGAYNSATGAGTVEGNALQNVRELGIDTSDLSSNQLESFTNQLRTETLQLNDWTEAQAVRLQQDQVMRLLHQEQIEAILESVRSK